MSQGSTDPNDNLEEQAWSQLGISAALAHSYASDQSGFLPMLASLLEASMPEAVEVERKPVRLFSSHKRITLVRVLLGDDSYMLQSPDPDGPLIGWRVKCVRGITLKTEQIPLEEWLDALGQRISERAARNERAAMALKNFLEIKQM